jgi:hypothetical protein
MLSTSHLNTKTVYFMKGYSPKACVFEESEHYDAIPSVFDEEDRPEDEEEIEYTFSEEEEIASFMAKNGLNTMDEYERFMDDAIEDYEERRRGRLFEASEF